MKEKKIFGMGTAISIFIVAIMISSATAVPVVNEDAVDNIIIRDEKDIYEEKGDARPFARIKNTLANLCLMLLNKLPFRGDPNTLLTDIVFIEQCWKYWEDDEVREETSDVVDSILWKIQQLPNQYEEPTEELLLLDETFNFDEIAKRILTLKPTQILDGVKDLLEIPDTFNDFKVSREEAFIQIINLFGQNDFQVLSMWYPLMFSICGLFKAISTLWVVPLAFLGGVAGIRLANLLTMVFFSPILLPMTLYCAMMECLDTDVELCEQVRQIFAEEGAIGVLCKLGPILFRKIFIDPCYYREAHRILMLYVLWVDIEGGGNTDQTEPHITEWMRAPITAKPNQDIKFTACAVYDNDWLYFCDLIGNEYWEKRDYIRVGWDWDNDYSVDDWSDWTKQKNGLGISFSRSWSKAGTYTVRCISMDNFGQLGEWSNSKHVIIKQGTSKSRTLPQPLQLLEKLGIW